MAAALTPHIASHGEKYQPKSARAILIRGMIAPLSSCFDLNMHPSKLTTITNVLQLHYLPYAWQGGAHISVMAAALTPHVASHGEKYQPKSACEIIVPFDLDIHPR